MKDMKTRTGYENMTCLKRCRWNLVDARASSDIVHASGVCNIRRREGYYQRTHSDDGRGITSRCLVVARPQIT